MAFTESDLTEHKQLMDAWIARRRPPEDIRDQVDLAYRIDRQSIEIYEIRPAYLSPDTIIHEEIAKTTYVRKSNTWRVFWMRADLKWHSYEPCPEVPSLLAFLKLVEEDSCCCFWG